MADSEKPQEGVNVQVLLRCRPVSDREVVDRTPQVISCNEAIREVTLFQNAGGKQHSKTFRFDKVFGPDSKQEKLFNQAIVPIVCEVMDGFNCTIFAYGQTGTGKTYTMEGGPRDSTDGRKLSAEAGVIPRSIKQIFDTIEAGNMDSTVKVSFLELYNEELTDLLSSGEDDKDASKKLRLLEDKSGVVVHGLEEAIVRSATEIYQVLDRGSAKRRTAATLLNNRSSRSHSVFTITIHLKETTPEGEDIIKIGKLNLVDLAGSENISRSGAKDSRAREAGSINQSLLTLGRVITTLVEHSGHIPYRDSKLTRLLRDSLGGRTKTCIIATIAPTVQCQEETISTLDYAHRAKNIRNRPELNQKISKTTMIKDLAAEIERLKVDLFCTREKNGVYISSERFDQGEMERIQLRDTVKGLKAEMELEEAARALQLEALKASHELEADALQSELDIANEQLASTQDQLNEAQITVQERQFMIMSHQRAEHALAGHAQRLTTELTACARDLGVMYSRMGEVTELHQGDRSVLQGLRSYVHTRMEQMGSFVAEAAASQQQYLASVAADLAALKGKKDKDSVQLRDQVAASQTHLTALQQSVNSGVTDLAALLDSAVAGVKSTSAGFSAQASAGLQATQQQANDVVQSLVAGLGGQAAKLQDLGGKHAAGLQASMSALQTLSAAAQGHLTGTSSSLAGLQQSIGQQHQGVDRAILDTTSALQASVEQQQQVLMKQVGDMLQAFAADRAREVTAAMNEMRQKLASDAKAISVEAEGISGSVAASAGKIKESEGSMVAGLESAGSALQTETASVGSALTVLGSQAATALPHMQEAFVQQNQLLQGYSEELSLRMDGSLTAVATAKQAAYGSNEASVARVAASCLVLQGAVADQHASDLATADAMLKTTAEAAQKLEAFSGACAQGTGETTKCVSHEVDERLARKFKLSSIPAQLALETPVLEVISELLCPPEDVVLQLYRNEKAQILRRGGDVKYANLLLSPTPMLSPPSGITMRSAKPGPALTMDHHVENQQPPSPFVSLMGLTAMADALAPEKAEASPAMPAMSDQQQQRSKIPGAPSAQSPGRARVGLEDRTNQHRDE